MLFIGAGIFSLFSIEVFYLHYINQTERIKKATKYLDKCISAMEALERWEQIRPFLYTGTCPYARRLIVIQIECLEYLKYKKFQYDSEYLEFLYNKLDDHPPKSDPPDQADFSIPLKKYTGVIGL